MPRGHDRRRWPRHRHLPPALWMFQLVDGAPSSQRAARPLPRPNGACRFPCVNTRAFVRSTQMIPGNLASERLVTRRSICCTAARPWNGGLLPGFIEQRPDQGERPAPDSGEGGPINPSVLPVTVPGARIRPLHRSHPSGHTMSNLEWAPGGSSCSSTDTTSLRNRANP